MSEAVSGVRQEWRKYYTLPIAAALGYATSVIHIYGLSPFIEPISQEFGWSRTQTTVGLTIAVAIQAFFGVPIGFLVDRVGPRILGLIGLVVTCFCFGLLGTASGDELNWYLLWALLAFAVLPVQATIWTSAVATRFQASRGLAFAIVMCGAAISQMLFPWLGTKLIEDHGWQTAFALEAAIWLAIAFPIIFLFFRGARDKQRGNAETVPEVQNALTGHSFLEGLRSTVYLRLLIASLLFTLAILGLIVHYIPVLMEQGLNKYQAAEVAGVIGLTSIAGRLGTGLLLDRFRGSIIGGVAFLLPVISCLLLLLGGGDVSMLMLASALIGLTLGAEVDVVVYLTTRFFGLKNFGALYGGLLAALSVGTAIGPLAASLVFDETGSYESFLWGIMGFMVASSLALITLPRPDESDQSASVI